MRNACAGSARHARDLSETAFEHSGSRDNAQPMRAQKPKHSCGWVSVQRSCRSDRHGGGPHGSAPAVDDRRRGAARRNGDRRETQSSGGLPPAGPAPARSERRVWISWSRSECFCGVGERGADAMGDGADEPERAGPEAIRVARGRGRRRIEVERQAGRVEVHERPQRGEAHRAERRDQGARRRDRPRGAPEGQGGSRGAIR